METTKIAELAKILKQNGLTKLDLTEGENRLVLEAAAGTAAPAAEAPMPVVAEVQHDLIQTASAVPTKMEEDFYEQKTPLVGTVYLAPQSGAAPFVSVGDHIAAGDPICIVESMKMFNQIAAECSGTIEEVCVANGQLVEYGQVLFRIRED